ncbi:hypothetical protein CRENBAI_018274 [Crenichthys baileyi]|uniref:Uncharacterized protein n=1 Tax=Crenichthys baileyi TaxID=28760 RepID=A0AAV9RXN1_9TELE
MENKVLNSLHSSSDLCPIFPPGYFLSYDPNMQQQVQVQLLFLINLQRSISSSSSPRVSVDVCPTSSTSAAPSCPPSFLHSACSPPTAAAAAPPPRTQTGYKSSPPPCSDFSPRSVFSTLWRKEKLLHAKEKGGEKGGGRRKQRCHLSLWGTQQRGFVGIISEPRNAPLPQRPCSLLFSITLSFTKLLNSLCLIQETCFITAGFYAAALGQSVSQF